MPFFVLLPSASAVFSKDGYNRMHFLPEMDFYSTHSGTLGMVVDMMGLVVEIMHWHRVAGKMRGAYG